MTHGMDNSEDRRDDEWKTRESTQDDIEDLESFDQPEHHQQPRMQSAAHKRQHWPLGYRRDDDVIGAGSSNGGGDEPGQRRQTTWVIRDLGLGDCCAQDLSVSNAGLLPPIERAFPGQRFEELQDDRAEDGDPSQNGGGLRGVSGNLGGREMTECRTARQKNLIFFLEIKSPLYPVISVISRPILISCFPAIIHQELYVCLLFDVECQN